LADCCGAKIERIEGKLNSRVGVVKNQIFSGWRIVSIVQGGRQRRKLGRYRKARDLFKPLLPFQWAF
jgi:hypothetical protein